MAGDGIIWETCDAELEEREPLRARATQGNEKLCSYYVADGEACEGEGGGSGGGEEGGDVLDDLRGESREWRLVEGWWARCPTEVGEKRSEVVHGCGSEEMVKEAERVGR
jgi:hypothetical protein